MDSKIKMTQTQCNLKKKTARKLKNNLKSERKQQEYRVLELKVQNNSKSNKNKPRHQIPHDMIPIARYR